MRTSLFNVFKYLIFLALALGLLYLTFKNTDPADVITALKTANYFWVLICMLCGYLAVVSRGVRWNILLEPLGYEPKTWNSIHAVNIGYLANLAVPRMGEITRCTVMNRAEKIPVDKLIGTVIMERIVDMLMLGLMILLTFVLKYNALLAFLGKSKVGASTGQPGGNNLFLIAAGFLLCGLVLIWLFRNVLLRLKWVGKAKDFVAGMLGGFRSLFLIRRKVAFLGHTFFIWGMYFLMSYLSFFCFEETTHLTVADGLFIMIVGGLAMIVPVPGGVGAFHMAVKMGLVILGISEQLGTSYGTLGHSSQTAMMAVTGLVALFLISLKSKKPNNDAVLS